MTRPRHYIAHLFGFTALFLSLILRPGRLPVKQRVRLK